MAEEDEGNHTVGGTVGGDHMDQGAPAGGVRDDPPSTVGQPDRSADLSPQERRLLNLVAEGLTDKEIGERLSMAERAVSKYVEDMLAKLGFETRTQAILFAINRAFQGTDPSKPPLFDEEV